MIGAAIVERILRAARAGEKYKMFVVMPAVPAFAGDLKDDASLGTRAIMEVCLLRALISVPKSSKNYQDVSHRSKFTR